MARSAASEGGAREAAGELRRELQTLQDRFLRAQQQRCHPVFPKIPKQLVCSKIGMCVQRIVHAEKHSTFKTTS